jgi:hypothetical protein
VKGQRIGQFRQAARGKTADRAFHQRRAPKPRAWVGSGNNEVCAEIVCVIRRMARHRSRLVALYVNPAGAVYVLPEDLSVSHQVWAAKHGSWLVGWYSLRVTVEDLRAALA